MEEDFLPIEDFQESEKYSSVVQRYYTPRYCLNVSQVRDDYCILIHSNRVCLVTLAPTHYLFKQGDVVSANFQVTEEVNRLENQVSGKWKHGAQKLHPKSALMVVNCGDGESYRLRCGISGKLLEVNQQLLQNPNLLLTEPQGKGYIAIVLPEIPVVQRYKDTLLNEEQYNLKCSELYGTEPLKLTCD